MLTKASLGEEADLNMPNRTLPALSLPYVRSMTYALIDTFRDTELPRESVTNAATVSDSIFADYIVPFEAVSVLLLAALIGAVVVARKE